MGVIPIKGDAADSHLSLGLRFSKASNVNADRSFRCALGNSSCSRIFKA